MSRRKEKATAVPLSTTEKGFCFGFTPPTVIAEEILPKSTTTTTISEDDQDRTDSSATSTTTKERSAELPKPSSRRSASLFDDGGGGSERSSSTSFGFSMADCVYRLSTGLRSKKTKGLVRRFSSPLLSTSCSRRANVENGNQCSDDSKMGREESDSALMFRDKDQSQERELVSRSVSLRLDDDGDLYESFSPADLEIKELLGKGFYGEVFKVIHRKTGLTMVLKKLYRMDAKGEQDFVKEAAVMRLLHHPNVLRFLGVLYVDKKLQLVTEFLNGGTLRQLLDSPDELSWSKRLSIAKDVASGMAYLHSKNVIHRDLNSGNILIREETCTAVVADFGLARVLGRRRAGRRRRLTVVGDPYLMAPEMSREQPYNERVDIFSYGVTLCEIIGRCSSDPDVMPRRQDFGIDQQRFVTQFVDDTCPRPFVDLAFKCASINPDERPPFPVVQRWLAEMLLSLDDEGVCDLISRAIKAFGDDADQDKREADLSERSRLEDEFKTPKTLPSPQKRRRSTDMGYASGRSGGESPRNVDVHQDH